MITPSPRLAAICLAIVLWCDRRASALNPALDVSQYAHTAWKIRDGFTKGAITSIAQTPDGYLWLGTELGLLQFDGVRAVPWQPPLGQRFPSSGILSLLVTRDGTLWIGTDRGLASWNGSQLTHYEALRGSFVPRLLEDRDGTIWTIRAAATRTLCAIRQNRVECYGEDGGRGTGAIDFFEDSKGNLWVGTLGRRNGVWRWRPGIPTFYPLAPQENGIQGLSEDADGALLIAGPGGIGRLANGKAEIAHSFPASMRPRGANRLRRDRDGGLWVGMSAGGLVHIHQGITDTFTQLDGLSGNRILGLFEDREGNIWVATVDGLDRFHDVAVASFSNYPGLSSATVNSVLTAADGSAWFGTPEGLHRWTDGQVTVYREGRPPATGGTNSRVFHELRELGDLDILTSAVESLFQDSRHRVWVSTVRGVGYLENDRFVLIPGLPGGLTRAIVEERRGDIWIANPDSGLFRVSSQNGAIEQIPWTRLNRNDQITTMVADPSQGGLWFGFFQGGIAYFADGQLRASYTTADGLGGGRVSALQPARDGALWVATDGGLSLLKSSRVTTLTARNGLPCDAVAWVIEDDDRSLWLGMPCGLVHIAGADIDGWIVATGTGSHNNDAAYAIPATVFDQADGVRIAATAIYFTAPVARAVDGKLWFTSQDGVSVVDPHRLPFNNLPPPVHVEQVIADRKTYDVGVNANGPVDLPALTRDVQIDFTALSLVAPEKNRFRIKLEGWDGDWQDVGNRRQAFYNNLPPRNYRFRVIASNNSGVWNETGASLDFSVAPAYYQTAWFVALSTATVIALVWGAHRLRLRIVETHRAEISALNERLMKAQEQERIRIAGEIHDGVMQDMLAVTMMLGRAKRRASDESEVKTTIDKVQEKLIRAGTELRQLSHDLHPPLLQDAGLPVAVNAYCEQFSTTWGIQVSCDADNSVHDLSRGAALALFRILQEALGNAAKHAAAKHIVVHLKRLDGTVSLTVADDGVGFDIGLLASGGGLGLVMMRERATQLNGTFEFESAPGRGTTIRVVIPFR